MTEIEQWLKSGAGVQEGLRLLSVYKPNPLLAQMVERHPDKYGALLVRTLAGVGMESVVRTATRSRSLREEWPFLDKPDCPPELKILAADKITAYRNYVREHEKLYSCSTLDDCLRAAEKCILFYCQNRKIVAEFAYYKEHGTVLGKHPEGPALYGDPGTGAPPAEPPGCRLENREAATLGEASGPGRRQVGTAAGEEAGVGRG